MIKFKSDGYTTIVELEKYPDGAPLIRTMGGVSMYLSIQTTSLEELVSALFWVDSMRERGAERIIALIPYLPCARQDRLLTKEGSDSLFALKSVANMINARDFALVGLLDVHSPVATGLINRSCNLTIWEEAPRFMQAKYQAVVCPDGGAAQRAELASEALGIPVLHGWKSRDVSTGKLTGFGIEPSVEDYEKVLIVDDICDGGGTFIGLAEAIEAYGAKADLCVTHGLFTKGLEDLKDHFETIYASDSIPQKDGVTVIPSVEALYRRSL